MPVSVAVLKNVWKAARVVNWNRPFCATVDQESGCIFPWSKCMLDIPQMKHLCSRRFTQAGVLKQAVLLSSYMPTIERLGSTSFLSKTPMTVKVMANSHLNKKQGPTQYIQLTFLFTVLELHICQPDSCPSNLYNLLPPTWWYLIQLQQAPGSLRCLCYATLPAFLFYGALQPHTYLGFLAYS